jgi:hypothetical protein
MLTLSVRRFRFSSEGAALEAMTNSKDSTARALAWPTNVQDQ